MVKNEIKYKILGDTSSRTRFLKIKECEFDKSIGVERKINWSRTKLAITLIAEQNGVDDLRKDVLNINNGERE